MNPDKWEKEMAQLVLSTVDGKELRIHVGDEQMIVEIASTPESRSAGLANREDMPHDGMLFIYPHNHNAGFERAQMLFDISIHFFDAEGELINSDRDSAQAFPERDYRYVLETSQDRELSGTLVVHGLT